MRRLLVGLVLLVFAAVGAGAQDVGIDVNSTPAPFILEDLDGKPVDLAQFFGKKPVVVEFWATWCSLCAALEPMMTATHKQYGDRVEFLIVAVGINQTTRSIKRHVEKKPVAGRMLWDGQGKAVRAFIAPGTSFIAVLDAKGRVVHTGFGGDQKLAPVLAKLVGR